MLDNVTIIIPSLNPEDKLINLVNGLVARGVKHLIVINDGSAAEFTPVFAEATKSPECVYLAHQQNQGKGAALKTAFKAFFELFPEDIGAVSCDADGQHTIEDIIHCSEMLQANPHKFILGVRDFSLPGVPPKSRFGNRLTRMVFLLTAGLRLTDTQTGLRGMPAKLIKAMQTVPGNRFEYESDVLLAAKEQRWGFLEVPIATVYENGNRTTHFRPIVDALKIYMVIFRHFARQLGLFMLISGASFGLDLLIAGVLYYCYLPENSTFVAVGVARIFSSAFNFWGNRYVVFAAKREERSSFCKSLFKYYLLAIVVFVASYALTEKGTSLLSPEWMLPVKAVADCLIFCCNFFVQRLLIFRKKQS